MLISRSIHGPVYERLKTAYGDHIDSIELFTRVGPDSGTTEYAASCHQHGQLVIWTKVKETQVSVVLEHLKGIY